MDHRFLQVPEFPKRHFLSPPASPPIDWKGYEKVEAAPVDASFALPPSLWQEELDSQTMECDFSSSNNTRIMRLIPKSNEAIPPITVLQFNSTLKRDASLSEQLDQCHLQEALPLIVIEEAATSEKECDSKFITAAHEFIQTQIGNANNTDIEMETIPSLEFTCVDIMDSNDLLCDLAERTKSLTSSKVAYPPVTTNANVSLSVMSLSSTTSMQRLSRNHIGAAGEVMPPFSEHK